MTISPDVSFGDVEAQKLAQAHLLPHFTKGQAWRSEHLGVIERGEGCYVYDTAGVEYLDGLAGLFCSNMGHGRADFAAAAAEQMEKLAFYPTWGVGQPAGSRGGIDDRRVRLPAISTRCSSCRRVPRRSSPPSSWPAPTT